MEIIWNIDELFWSDKIHMEWHLYMTQIPWVKTPYNFEGWIKKW